MPGARSISPSRNPSSEPLKRTRLRKPAQSIFEYVVIAAAIALAAIFVETIMGGPWIGVGIGWPP